MPLTLPDHFAHSVQFQPGHTKMPGKVIYSMNDFPRILNLIMNCCCGHFWPFKSYQVKVRSIHQFKFIMRTNMINIDQKDEKIAYTNAIFANKTLMFMVLNNILQHFTGFEILLKVNMFVNFVMILKSFNHKQIYFTTFKILIIS